MIVCICEDRDDARIPDGAAVFVSLEDFWQNFQRDPVEGYDFRVLSPLEPTPDILAYWATFIPEMGEMEIQSYDGPAMVYPGFIRS